MKIVRVVAVLIVVVFLYVVLLVALEIEAPRKKKLVNFKSVSFSILFHFLKYF